jgi:single-strand DNA-binding protein
MAGLNRVFILGRLGKDPELRYLQNANKTAVCKFNVATSKSYTTKDSNEKKELIEWHRLTIWGKLGELAHKYLKKGDGCCFVGELKTSSYDKDGQKHYATEVVVSEIHFLPSRKDVNGASNQQNQSNQSNQGNSPGDPPDFENDPGFQASGGDDDIPF